MLKNRFTAKEVAEILDIYEVSAQELLDGIIEWEADELFKLANVAGLTVEQLLT